ncbi:MAG: R3H domain-containing nucleic acid-binding protein [candidate division WOR-3 bacterium]
MEYIDAEGATPDEALRKVLSKVGLEPHKVRYEVLVQGGGMTRAKVRVWIEPKEVQEAKRIIKELMKKIGARAKVDFLLIEKKHYRVNLRTRSWDRVLIGKGGETLRCLEHLINLMLRRNRIRMQVDLDISDYRERQKQFCLNKALAVAARVKETGQEMTLDTIPPDQRRYIREVLRLDPDVRVYTAGRGSETCLVIAPKKQGNS